MHTAHICIEAQRDTSCAFDRIQFRFASAIVLIVNGEFVKHEFVDIVALSKQFCFVSFLNVRMSWDFFHF